MPWKIVKNDSGCSASKPWGVRKTTDNDLAGCHESREKAARQVAALNAAKDASGKEIREAAMEANAQESFAPAFAKVLAATRKVARSAEFIGDVTGVWIESITEFIGPDAERQAQIMVQVSADSNDLVPETVTIEQVDSVVEEHMGGVERYSQLIEATLFKEQIKDPTISIGDALEEVLATDRVDRLAEALTVHLRNGIEYLMLEVATSTALVAGAASDPFSRRKAWITMLDLKVRAAHGALHGTSVPVSGVFIVGGFTARYPADPVLPASMRLNCRCFLMRADDIDIDDTDDVADIMGAMIARRRERLAAARRVRDVVRRSEIPEGISPEALQERLLSDPNVVQVLEATPEAVEAITGGRSRGLIEAILAGPAELFAFLFGRGELSMTVESLVGDCSGGCGQELAGPLPQVPGSFRDVGPDFSNGVMICVRPTEEQAEQLVMDGGLPASDMHITLAFFGEVEDNNQDQLQEVMRGVVEDLGLDGPITGEITGVTVFEGNDSRPLVALVDAPGLGRLREKVRAASVAVLGDQGPSDAHDFMPHITLAYEASEDGADEDEARSRIGVPLTFDALELSFGIETSTVGFSDHEEDDQETDMGTTTIKRDGVEITSPNGAELAGHKDKEEDEEEEDKKKKKGRPFTDDAELAGHEEEDEDDKDDDEEKKGRASVSLNAARAEVGDFDARAVLVVEGVESGDRRRIARGALEFRELPLPLMLQTINPETGGHAGAVVAGSIWTLERVGDEIVAGIFFDSGTNGQEALRLIQEGTMRGISVDLDMLEADIEIPEDGSEPRMLMTKARVMGATITPFPAFQEAFIEILETALVAGAIDYLAFEADHAALFGDRETLSVWRTNIPFNITLNEKDVPLVASGNVVALPSRAPERPPSAWFGFTPEHDGYYDAKREADGRVHGYVSDWVTCHIGFNDRCITAPHSREDYGRYKRGGGVFTAEGNRIQTGVIYVGCGHANLHLGWEAAMDAMSNAGHAIIDVVPYETPHGIYVAGAVRPAATESQLRAFDCQKISPDWRPLDGGMEMVGLVVVNTSGLLPAALVAAGLEAGCTVPADGQVRVEWDFVNDTPLAMVAVGLRVDPAQEDGPTVPLAQYEELETRLDGVEKFLAESRATAAAARIPAPPPEPKTTEDGVVALERIAKARAARVG